MWHGIVGGVVVLMWATMGTMAAENVAPGEAPFVKSLSGTWQFAPAGADQFVPAMVPGTWTNLPNVGDYKAATDLKGGTFRRTFEVPDGFTGMALEFDAIRWGGEVLVNGQSVATETLGYSPVWVDVSGAVRAGENVLEVRPRGWTTVERFETGDVQVPSAAAHWFGDKAGGIVGDVFVRFYRGAHVGAVRIETHTQGPSCDLSVEVSAGPKAWKGRLNVLILADDGRAVSEVQTAGVELTAGQTRQVAVKGVSAGGAALWSPESPAMHRAAVWLEAAGETAPASVREESFGFRQITLKDGHVWVNGRRVALHGYSGVSVYGNFPFQRDDQTLKAFQVTVFKAMNGRAFRSHMDPLSRKWLDLCDRAGVLAIPELPNFPDVQRLPKWSLESPYDRPAYWQNLQREIAGILRVRANHPSIVAWSASNEGSGFGDWERENLYPLMKRLDPTRPVLFSSDVTADIADSHLFMGNWYGTPAEFERAAAALAREYPDRPVACTEFAQFRPDWLHYGKELKDDEVTKHGRPQLTMEEIETLRRLRFDVIMPFSVPDRRETDLSRMSPVFHAMRNALAPLGVSLNPANGHAAAGAEQQVSVWVMSDGQDVSGAVSVEVVLLADHPGYDWDGKVEGRKVVWQRKLDFTLRPWAAEQQTVELTLPEQPGQYTLAAVARGAGGTTPISLKPLHIAAPSPAPVRKLAVGVIEKDGKLAAWLQRRGHRVVLPYGQQKPDVVVVGEGQLADARLRNFGFAVSARIKQGVRLVILEQQAWVPDAFTGDVLRGLSASTLRVPTAWVFADDAELSKSIGYAPGLFNGYDGVGLRVRLEPAGAASAPAAKLGGGQPDDMATSAPATVPATAPATAPAASDWTPLMVSYTRGSEKPDWAVVQGQYGQGAVVACQVPLIDRVDPTHPIDYDPIAETLLAWLVEGQR